MTARTAAALRQNKDNILQIWERQVREAIYASRNESRTTLRDGIPHFLDDLAVALDEAKREIRPEIVRFATHHARERVRESDFSIEDALSEYNILRRVLFSVLEESVEVTPLCRDIIFEAISLGVAKAGAEFAQQQIEIQREKESQFKELANALPMIIWTATPDMKMEWYNEWWYSYLDMPAGKRWQDHVPPPIHPDDMKRVQAAAEECIKNGSDIEVEIRFRRGSDGQYRWHLIRGIPLKDDIGNITKWIGANTDIHELKLTQESLEEETALRDKFAGALTHDLRTPLTAAKMAAELLKRKLTDPQEQNLAERIIDSVDRTNKLIEDLLDAGRIRAGKAIVPRIQKTDVVDVARKTIEDLKSIYGDRYRLYSPDRLDAYLSPTGFRRILENLGSNAIKYGSASRPVEITIVPGDLDLQLCVHNSAHPQIPVTKEKLFQLFERGHAVEAGGTVGWGIGLMVVKGITEGHGGQVTVETTDEGTTFKIKLPRDARPMTGARFEVTH